MNMTSTEAQKRASIKYQRTHYKRIPLDVPKEYYDEVLKPAADAAGESINGFIKGAIAQRINGETERKKYKVIEQYNPYKSSISGVKVDGIITDPDVYKTAVVNGVSYRIMEIESKQMIHLISEEPIPDLEGAEIELLAGS